MTTMIPPELQLEPYTAGKFALELDSVRGGWLSSADGGHATAEVSTAPIGPDNVSYKSLGILKYDDVSLTCGAGMSRAVFEWVKSSFDKSYTRKTGAIITCNGKYEEMSRLDFQRALITEVGFPALDSNSKEFAQISLKFRPEFAATKPGTRVKLTPTANEVDPAKQKLWSPASFDISIGGLDRACDQVSKIDAITYKQKVTECPVGRRRTAEIVPGPLEVSNIVITTSEAHAAELYQWHEDFCVKGNLEEKTATLQFLSPATAGAFGSGAAKVLCTLTLQNLGIFKLTPEKVESNSNKIRSIKAEMYCEQIKFEYSSAAVWS